jgi:hypothetical protein
VEQAIQEAMKNSPAQQQSEKDAALARSLQPPDSSEGPVADAHRKMSQGKFDDAAKEFEKLAENFKNMNQQQQQVAQDQLRKLAEQLEQNANNGRAMQDLADKLNQLGLGDDMIQQMQGALPEIVAGDADAQKLLDELARQAMENMSKMSQEQLRQALQQAQAMANAQWQQGQMSTIMLRMADAMDMNDPNAQVMLMKLNGELNGDLDGMAMLARNAADMQNARDGIDEAKIAAAGLISGGGGAGRATGKRADPVAADYTTSKEKDSGSLDPRGRFIARQFIQGSSPKGESVLELQKVIEGKAKEAGEDVDDSRADPRQRAVMEQYFNRFRDEANKAGK